MDRTAHYYGRDRSLLWPGPLITMAGTAPGPHRTLITMTGPAPGPHRVRTKITMAGSAPRHSLLRPGPHRPRITLGRARHTVWTLQSNFQEVWGRRRAPQCKLLSLIFTNQITLYPRLAPKRCLNRPWLYGHLCDGRGAFPISLRMASMPAHVECKPWAGIFDSLTWAPALFLAWKMVPFFPDKNALHPCTLTVCACTSGIYVAMYFTIVACSGKQQYTSKQHPESSK